MYDLESVTRTMLDPGETGGHRAEVDAARYFVERVTFAPADEILDVLRRLAAEDWMAMPPWARNLAYRLACLQLPTDAALLREAAADLISFGPDWDAHAHDLRRRADLLETPAPAG